MEEQRRVSVPLMRINRRKESTKLKGPLRLTRLCILSIILPGILIAGPLYLRYRVYSGQIYPVGMSDMRLVDKRISTTWCQRQLVKSNATFNAYLLPEEPKTKPTPVLVKMVRYLDLDDDMKEYWGFYLLKGSSFTVSTCCRWPGAYLTVIRGHKQLRECAYFGDDSSEEEDEMEEIRREKEEKERREGGKGSSKDDDAKSNEPWIMKKARPGVVFHGSQEADTGTKHRMSKEIVGDNENEQYNEWFSLKNGKRKGKSFKKPLGLNAVGVREEVKKVFNKTETVEKSSQTSVSETAVGGDVVTATVGGDAVVANVSSDAVVANVSALTNETQSENSGENLMEVLARGKNDSEEIYQDVLNKIRGLGHRGKNMLLRLSQKLTDDSKERVKNSSKERTVEKREIKWHAMHENLNKDDEDYDAAEEEGNPMDEDIRGTFNGTTLNDKSDSEFWSSFSSSEERLLNCAGLIVNLPLIPKKGCHPDKPEEAQAQASLANKFTYTVPTNGYYFFVFSSENEIQPNYIRVEFQLEKILYNVSNPVAACTNTTESCSLPLNFFSREKTVLEMPVTNNDSMWNQEYVVVSVCEPRTMVYAACVIAVPVLILLFAF